MNLNLSSIRLNCYGTQLLSLHQIKIMELKKATNIVPLRYLSHFWRSFEISLITNLN